MDNLACSLVRVSAVRVCAVRARSLRMASCLMCGTVRPRTVLSAAGCAVYAGIGTCAPYFTRVFVRYDVRLVQRMVVCLMCCAVRPRATYQGGVCGQSLYWSL